MPLKDFKTGSSALFYGFMTIYGFHLKSENPKYHRNTLARNQRELNLANIAINCT